VAWLFQGNPAVMQGKSDVKKDCVWTGTSSRFDVSIFTMQERTNEGLVIAILTHWTIWKN
jgi:hypothetical protein